MTGKIFLNYRRGDDPGNTGRLYDRLEPEFGADQLFMDVEGDIRGGDDFVDVLKAQVTQSDVLLAVIGPRWLADQDEHGRRRLDNPEDWVRVEIEGALEARKRVIPVLVGGASIPRAADLPEPLKPLARRQAIRITLERFKADTQGLINQIKASLAETLQARMAATEPERRAVAETERKRREEEARLAEKERLEGERIRQQAQADATPEEIARTLELENWNIVKDKDDPAELRDHIARYAGGPTEREAKERLATLVWASLGASPGREALQAFLNEFPNARQTSEATAALARVEAARTEAEAWGLASQSNGEQVLRNFIATYPNSQHAGEAARRLRWLRLRNQVFWASSAAATLVVVGCVLVAVQWFRLAKTTMEDTELIGGDVGLVLADLRISAFDTTLWWCRMRCIYNFWWCKAYSYDRRTRRCYLKEDYLFLDATPAARGNSSAYLLGHAPPQQTPFTMYWSQVFESGDAILPNGEPAPVAVLEPKTAEEARLGAEYNAWGYEVGDLEGSSQGNAGITCQRLCLKQEKCVGFTFNTLVGRCKLFGWIRQDEKGIPRVATVPRHSQPDENSKMTLYVPLVISGFAVQRNR